MNPVALLAWLCLPALAQDLPTAEDPAAEETPTAEEVPPVQEAPATEEAPVVEEASTVEEPLDELIPPTDEIPAASEFAPEPLGEVPPELEEPAAPPSPEVLSPEEQHALEARAMARMALEMTVESHWDDARALFARLESQYGDTPEGVRAAAHIHALDIITSGGSVPYVAVPTGDGAFEIRDPRTGRRVDLEQHPRREPINGGQRELAVTQAIVGAGLLGVAVPFAIDEPEFTLVFLGLGAGASAGALASVLVTRQHPITRGQAGAIGAGELIGGWNGAVIGAALSDGEPWQVALPVIGGTLLGGLAGTEAALQAKPSAGQVGMVTQGALWGLGLGGLSFLVVPSDDDRATMVRLGVASDLGALAGVGLATKFDPSRKRVNLIGLSGVGGLAVGAAAQVMLREAVVDTPTVTAASLAVGTLGGLGLGTWLTRHVDGGAEQEEASLGHPAPWVGQTQDGAPVVGVALAGGRF